jgi:integrase
MGVRVREKVKGSKVYWLFINHHGRRKAKRVGDKKAAELAATKIRAKLAEGDRGYRNPEQLRHTLASVLLSRNAPLLYVQRVGGWKSATVLLDVYARWLPQEGVGEVQGQPNATPAQPRAVAQRTKPDSSCD